MIVLGLVSMVDQIDMAILRGVLPILEDEWHLSDFKLGLLGFSFIFINTVATVPAGWVADHYRRNRIMGWTLVSWSGLIVLSATAVNYWNLVFARALMGIGQAVDDPASTSLIGDFYPGRMRSRVFSVQQIAFFVGGGVGLGLGGWVGEALGWRWAFMLIGVPGSLIALLAFRLREPVRGEADLIELGVDVTTREFAAVAGQSSHDDASLREFARRAASELYTELRMIFGIRTMRYILVGVSALLFTVSGIGYWLAIYHQRFSDMSLTQATSFTAAVLGVGGGIGTILGGYLADRSARRGPSGRIEQVVYSAIGCAALFMLSFAVQSIPLRLALQFVGVLSAAGAAPALRAAMMDVIPAESRGVGASAFALAAALFGTALAPPLVGLLADITGSLVTAFTIVFPPVILGLLLLLRARRTIVDDAAAIITAMAERAALHEPVTESGPRGGDSMTGSLEGEGGPAD